jgi:hypothetical protein
MNRIPASAVIRCFLCVIFLLVIPFCSCDFKKKWDRRERKLHYLQEEIDSARKREDHFQDSVWRALDSAKQQRQ